MPRIELIQPIFYGPDDPIHWEVDNLPLKSILTRQTLINLGLDNVIAQMRDAIGTQNTVANRLNQSINPDGTLKTAAIDQALHTMDDHTDTDNYVRMTLAQSDKLDLIADEATNLGLQIYTDATTFITFNQGVVKFEPSDTVTPSIEAPNIVKFNFAFPTDVAHRHFYGLNPVPSNLVNPDFVNYLVDSVSSVFITGSLRIHINGIRIFSDAEVYVPGSLVSDAWTLISFTENSTQGTFELSSAITDEDVIRVDFDIQLA